MTDTRDITFKIRFDGLERAAGRAIASLETLARRFGMETAQGGRERRRREIDAVLREDARRFPAFATARRAAVMASAEAEAMPARTIAWPSDAKRLLRYLREYEKLRGGCAPTTAARAFASGLFADAEIAAYERARSLP